MTVQAEAAQGTTSSTELEPVAAGALALVKSSTEFTALDLAAILAGPEPVLPQDAPLPGAPVSVKFNDVLRRALKAIPDLFGQVMPEEARALDRTELKALTDETNTINTIVTEAKARLEAIKEAIRNHQDKVAEEAGLPEGAARIAEGSAKGHWLLAAKGHPHGTPVEGYTDTWQQRRVESAVTVDASVLFDMAKNGEITREEFLAFTSEVRVYNPDKAKSFIRKNPERGLRILARMTKRSAPSASLYAPKK